MATIRMLLYSTLVVALASGCGQTGKSLPAPLPPAPCPERPALVVLPFADYSRIDDVEVAHHKQQQLEESLAKMLTGSFRLTEPAAVYDYLTATSVISPMSYDKDIQPAANTASMEDQLNEDWSDMLKSELADLIQLEKLCSLPGIATQDNHLPVPGTVQLDQERIIDLGSEFQADYVLRGRILEYNLRPEHAWEPLRRNILPFLQGKDALERFGTASALHYDNLDNLVIGGGLTDLGREMPQAIRLQMWVQDGQTGEIVWTNQLQQPLDSIHGEDYADGLTTAVGSLIQDFWTRVAVDGDQDCVWDHKDNCPDTPAGIPVDVAGCPADSDGDGIPDFRDACPDTQLGAAVDEKGCPLDSDQDGIMDYLDDCPETMAGTPVDQLGCPKDADGDGVWDSVDKCPDTPFGVAVDENGCPPDSDGDGVPDYLDECPDTPRSLPVDILGCPADSDGDGVFDHLDKCPETPEGAIVDENGCPAPMEKEQVSIELKIEFEFDKADIKPQYHEDIKKVADFLKGYPDTAAVIEGHTDNEGTEEYNQELSLRRAENVKQYLVEKFGITPERLTARGFGESRPVASNETQEGKQSNRRSVVVVTATVIE